MIDPKELRIGSHVNLDNKRAKIVCLEPYSKIFPCSVEAHRCGLPTIYHLEDMHDLEPIPITEELLTELGFEKVTLQTRPKPIIQYVDAESIKAQAEDLNVRVVPRITIQYINVTNPFWSVSAYGENMEDNRMAVRYLHELEAFLYLTTKTELIKE